MRNIEYGMSVSRELNKIYTLWQQRRIDSDMKSKVYSKQIGGTHYKDMKIQPSKFINHNKLLFAEGNAIKYICRHASKGEVKDLEKAKHYIDMIIERDYEDTEV